MVSLMHCEWHLPCIQLLELLGGDAATFGILIVPCGKSFAHGGFENTALHDSLREMECEMLSETLCIGIAVTFISLILHFYSYNLVLSDFFQFLVSSFFFKLITRLSFKILFFFT